VPNQIKVNGKKTVIITAAVVSVKFDDAESSAEEGASEKNIDK